jgi:hypothetical protein
MGMVLEEFLEDYADDEATASLAFSRSHEDLASIDEAIEEVREESRLEATLDAEAIEVTSPRQVYMPVAEKPAEYRMSFSYLGSGVKVVSEYDGYYRIEPSEEPYEIEGEMAEPALTEKDIRAIIRAKKIKDILGLDLEINPMLQGRFDEWKHANYIANQMIYDVITLS